jgi:hypothetical protein
MDSYVYGWRALGWVRVWAAVVVFTLAWSIGVGMALRAVTPPYGQPGRGDCLPTAVQPLAATPADWLWLPVHAAIAAPFGLYVSGLQFALAALVATMIPAALLPQGMVCRRVLSVPMMTAGAAVLVVAGWTCELAAVAAHGLPSLVCSASGY